MALPEPYEVYLGVPIYFYEDTKTFNVSLPGKAIGTINISEARAFIDQYYRDNPEYVPPPIVTPPRYESFEVYRGVEITHDRLNDSYGFSFEGVDQGWWVTLADARSRIDELISAREAALVGEVVVETYKGIQIRRSTATGEYAFTYAGQVFSKFTDIASARAFIDVLVAKKPEIPTPTPKLVIPTLPWYASWLQPLAEYFGSLWESGVNYFGQKFADGAKAADAIVSKIEGQFEETRKSNAETRARIDAMPSGIWEGLVGSVSDLFKKTAEESLSKSLEAISTATGKSPEWKAGLESVARPFAEEQVANLIGVVSPEAYTKSIISPEDAASKLTLLGAGVAAANVGIWVAHLAAESATLGQLEAVGQLSNIVMDSLGVNAISSRALMIPIEKSVLIPAEQHYNAVYTPLIPSYQDLIEMVVKEVITLDEFKHQMKYLGYSEQWSQFIWNKHFIPPTLSDILIAWRRGEITEADVDKLFILIDLDPRYKDIFDTRKYNDPSLSLTRFFYETGAITEAQVADLVHRTGVHPDYEKATVNFVLGFQERLFRRRYLTTLLTGVIRGAYTPDELTKAVKNAGYSEGVAKWMIEIADARKKIAAYRAPVTMKARLLSTGDLTKAFERDLITEDVYRTELMVRGYEIGDVDLKVKLILGEKVVELAGGPKVALSQAELLNAWRWGEMSEDAVRIELQLRGLSPEETDILIATKKKQWTVTPK